MLSPASRRFSMSTSRLTPSTTIWTSSTSENPRRSALEMSKTPPTAAVSTPPETQTGSDLTGIVTSLIGTSVFSKILDWSTEPSDPLNLKPAGFTLSG
uniref:Uncharacterized protein n=1 Tax=Anabas testudineus TaxID=64144 RepID=A0A3Q1HTK7_ANATE